MADVPPGFEPVESVPEGVPEGFEAVPEGFESVPDIPTEDPIGRFGVASPSRTMELGREEADRLSRRRQQRDREIFNAVGDEYDPNETFSPDFGGFFRLMDVARSADLADKQEKFRRTFPDGDLIAVETVTGTTYLARAGKDEKYRQLGILPDLMSGIGSEPVAGAVAGSFLGLPGTIGGTIAGVLGQQRIERERGFGAGEGGVGRAIEEGVIEGAADVAFRGGGRIVAGIRRTAGEADALSNAIRAAEELGLPPLTIGQTGGPFTRGMFRQVGATSSRVERVMTEQQEALLRTIKENAEANVTGEDSLKLVVRAQQDDLNRMLNTTVLSRKDAGETLNRIALRYKTSSRKLGDRLYERAITLSDDVTFNLAPAKEAAEEINTGVLGRGEPGEFVMGMPVEGSDQVRLTATPKGELREVVDDLLRLDTRVRKNVADGGEWTAFEQIKALRSRLFDLTQSDDGMVRRNARMLWDSMTRVMDNPVSGDPAFVRAYKTASGFNRHREQTLRASYIARILRNDTPEDIGRRYMAPGHATELAMIRDLAPLDKWNEFRGAFVSDIAASRTARTGLTSLDNFKAKDPDGLRILLSPREEHVLRTYLLRKARFESSPAAQLIQKELTDVERSVALAKQGSAGELRSAVELSGGKTSSFALTAKAGVYRDILSDATTTNPQGIEVVDPKKLLASIAKWKESGKLDFLFDEKDWAKIEGIQNYTAPLSETADIGGGMMAGGLRQQAIAAPMTLWTRAEQVFKGVVRPLFSNSLTAFMLSRPVSFSRVGMNRGGLDLLRQMGIAAVAMEREVTRGEE